MRIATRGARRVFVRHPPLRLLSGALALAGWVLLLVSGFLPTPWAIVGFAAVPVFGGGAILAGNAGPTGTDEPPADGDEIAAGGARDEAPGSVRLSAVLLVVYAAGFVAVLVGLAVGLPDLVGA